MKKNDLEKMRGKEVKSLLENIKTLDMGGADGWMVSNKVSPNKVTVLDLDKEALLKNPAKNKIYGDLVNNKLKNGDFPQITLFEVIEHVEKKKDRIKIFSEANRILSEGGKFVISTPNYERFSTQIRKTIGRERKYPYPVAGGNGVLYTDWHYFEYSEKSIREDLRAAGFSKIKTYCKFIQIPYFQNFFDVKSRWGLVLYVVAIK